MFFPESLALPLKDKSLMLGLAAEYLIKAPARPPRAALLILIVPSKSALIPIQNIAWQR